MWADFHAEPWRAAVLGATGMLLLLVVVWGVASVRRLAREDREAWLTVRCARCRGKGRVAIDEPGARIE